MLKSLIYPFYRLSHDVLFATRTLNPWFPKAPNGKLIKTGHISEEHLSNPRLDDELEESLIENGILVQDYVIDIQAYQSYLQIANYPKSYYGGGKKLKDNFTEKSLEHFVSTQFLDLAEESAFIDIAACTSPFSDIVKELYGVRTSYRQDLIYPRGIHENKIGGWAHELFVPNESIDAVSLHCSLEHFEGESDTLFFQELERVLKKRGKAVVLPFYLAYEHSNHIDPAYNLLKQHYPPLDSGARLRYCSWYQYFSRHYDPVALRERILSKAESLQLRIYRVRNFQEISADSYLRWIGVFEKK